MSSFLHQKTFKAAKSSNLSARYVLDNGKVAVTVDAAWDIPKIRRYVEKKDLRPAALSALPLHHAFNLFAPLQSFMNLIVSCLCSRNWRFAILCIILHQLSPPGRWRDIRYPVACRLVAGLYTHGHFDHVGGKFPGAPVLYFPIFVRSTVTKLQTCLKAEEKDKPLRTDIDMSEIFVSNYATKVLAL